MRKLTILLVEDSEDDVFFMKRAMKKAGISNPMHVVEDGQKAVDYLSGKGDFADRTIHPLPCLVLLDLKLPLKPGLEVLSWIRQQPEFKKLITIILTSSAEKSDIDNAYLLGANSYLVKPCDLEERVRMVNLLKEYWLESNRFPSECGGF